MDKILNKRLLRDLLKNFGRYLAMMLLIMLGIYVVVSIVGSAEMVIRGTENFRNKNKVEDGQFSVFIPLTDKELEKLTDQGTVIEEIFHFDVRQEGDAELRVFRNRENIDLVMLEEGRLARSEGEVTLEKNYAKVRNLQVGDVIKVADSELLIVGLGSVPDYDAVLKTFSSPAADAKTFGLCFVTKEQYEKLRITTGKTEEYVYAYRLGRESGDELKEKIKNLEFDYEKVENPYFRETIGEALDDKKEMEDALDELCDGSEDLAGAVKEFEDGVREIIGNGTELSEGAAELADGIREFRNETEDLLDELYQVDLDNLTSFVKAEDNIRIEAAAGDVVMDKRTGLVAGVIVLILFAYVLSVFIVHQIEGEQSVIGALYSLGVKKGNLLRHYVKLPTILAAVAGILGCGLAFSPLGIGVMSQSTYDYFSIPQYPVAYAPYLILYGVVMPPLVVLVVNLISVNGKLSRTALSLLRNEQKGSSRKQYQLKIKSFTGLFAIRQLLRESRSAVIVIIGMLITLMVVVLGVNTSVLCTNVKDYNVKDTTYAYAYSLKYPEKEVPPGGEGIYAESLSIECLGYYLDVSVMGIDGKSRYFDVSPEKGKNKAVVNRALVQRYGFRVGDKITLEDRTQDVNYTFTITGISEYSVGFTIFMDAASMRELFDKDEDYYNVIYADEDLHVEEGRLYSVTKKEDVVKSSSVFIDTMQSLIVTLIGAGSLIFCVVMYLMLAVMIDRSTMGISLIKIFGYRPGEIRKLYLNGNTAVVAVGGLITLPLAKYLIDKIYPSFIPNVACSMYLEYSWQLYLGIYVGMMAVYFCVNALLLRKINRISPVEILKERE